MKCWALKEADEASSIKPSLASIAVFIGFWNKGRNPKIEC